MAARAEHEAVSLHKRLTARRSGSRLRACTDHQASQVRLKTVASGSQSGGEGVPESEVSGRLTAAVRFVDGSVILVGAAHPKFVSSNGVASFNLISAAS